MDARVEEFVFTAIRKCIGDDLAESDISLQTQVGEIQLDSLGMLELVYELEDNFEVTLDANALSDLERIDDIVNMISAAVLKAA